MVSDVARELGISEPTVRTWEKAGRIRAEGRTASGGYRLSRLRKSTECGPNAKPKINVNQHGKSPRKINTAPHQNSTKQHGRSRK